MRTADELIYTAVNLHQRLMDEGKDPVEHVFYVTQEELSTLKDLPPFNHPMLNAQRDRLCGMMLRVDS
jgi:hypothetical protein